MKNYRIAMVMLEKGGRPECHAWHYAPFMVECDPAVLKKGYYGIYVWFHNRETPDWLNRVQPIGNFEIAKCWDIQSVERARDFARLVKGDCQVCESIEEMWDDVDAAFIADGGGDGSLHLEHVTPYLERGIPAFIDKPFACDYKDAKAMVDLARKTDTPIMSASILSHVNEIDALHIRMKHIPPPGLALVTGYGHSLDGKIHGLGLVQGIFGTGVEWVECMGPPTPGPLSLRREDVLAGQPYSPGDGPLEVMQFYYRDDIQVILINRRISVFDYFTCDVWGKCERTNPPRHMHLRSREIGDLEFLGGSYNIIRLFKKMLDERKPPIPYEVPLELIAVVEAGRIAQRERRRVYLKEFAGDDLAKEKWTLNADWPQWYKE